MINATTSPREEVLAILHELALPADQYVLAGSGILAIRDLRHPGDIDIFTTTKLWFDLLRQEKGTPSERWAEWTWEPVWKVFTTDPADKLRKSDPAYLYCSVNGVEVNIFNSWRIRDTGNINVAELLNSVQMIDGIPCQTLKSLQAWKSSIRREKDIPDLDLIQKQILIEEAQTAHSRNGRA